MKTALLALCAVAVATVGCANASAQPSDDAAHGTRVADCSRLEADLARAKQTRRDAAEKQADAWKAVVPFAVAARYASGKAAAADADKQIEALRAAAERQGCARPAS